MKPTGNPLIDESTAEWVVGSDEVGYGAWAGPLVVCAVALPRGWSEKGVGDSKKVSKTERVRIATRFVKETPVLYHLVKASNDEIDQEGVATVLPQCHRMALEGILKKVKGEPLIIVDGFKHGTRSIGVPGAIGLPEGDGLIPAVSLASIIAKVTRDMMMVEMSKQYPGYFFADHKGYRSEDHEDALRRLGPCAIHRKSYAPIARLLRGEPL